MLRLIVREVDTGDATHVGSPVDTRWKTFDVDLPAVERHLGQAGGFNQREIVGVEVIVGLDNHESTSEGE